MIKKISLPVVLVSLFCSCAILRKNNNQKDISRVTVQPASVKADTTKKVSKPKAYKEVITDKAITDDGLFKVHKVEDKYYFEIPDSLFDRDLLVVSRVAKAAAESAFKGGDEIGEKQVLFSKGPNNKVYLKMLSYIFRANDTSENGMYRALQNSNVLPIVAAFDISAFSPDSAGVVIDMTSYLNGDNNMFFFTKGYKEKFGMLDALDPERSYIKAVKSYPINVEINTVKTYIKSTSKFGANTYELNTSIVLLPHIPMKPRFYDLRVGYFWEDYGDFDANPQGVKVPDIITRWRLEPKPEDVEKYKRGQLVEPAKPIVYYVDPATPKKWVPYLIQGVNDWQKAFEKAGFKNAIYALEAPKNDSTWSLYDATHNAIVYKASDIANASGPNVHDPRSGEILETHIDWYHNVMQLIHDWYMIQAGPSDPKARKMQFDDSLMGQLIRFVSSHEVGHTLGLMHNFGASSTIPVEKLRDKKWVEENGFCPSIMDYARFNYVAQPEDSISEKGIFPRIGAYDEWAIEWGYRCYPDLKTVDAEKTYLNQLVINRITGNSKLFYGDQAYFGMDPRCQSEDLGDNAVLASSYGIKNLQRVIPQLMIWTKTANDDYADLRKIYSEVVRQYRRYLFHVVRNIGGINYNPKTVEQSGNLIDFTPAKVQKSTVKFLSDQLFIHAPEWLINFNKDTKVFSMIGGGNKYDVLKIQDTILRRMLSIETFVNLSWFEMVDSHNAYTVKELFNDLESSIWGELNKIAPIGYYRRYLQKAYVARLIELIQVSPNDPVTRTDIATIIRMYARSLYEKINNAIPRYKDAMSKANLIDMKRTLKLALDPNAQIISGNQIMKNENAKAFDFKFYLESKLKHDSGQFSGFGDCWKEDAYEEIKCGSKN